MLAMPCSQNRNLKCIRICKLPVSSSCLGTFLIIPILPYQFLHYLVIYCICTYNMCYVYTNLCMLCVFVILFYKVISNKQQMKDRKSLKLNSNVKVIDLTGKEKWMFSNYQEMHQQHTKSDEDSSKCISQCI